MGLARHPDKMPRPQVPDARSAPAVARQATIPSRD